MEKGIRAGGLNRESARAEAQGGPGNRPKSRRGADAVAVSRFDGDLERGEACGRENFLANGANPHSAIINGRAAVHEGDFLAVDPKTERCGIGVEDGRFCVALESEFRLSSGSAGLDGIAADDGFDAGEFGEGNDGAIDPESGLLAGEGLCETFQSHGHGDTFEIFQNANGFDGARVHAAVEEPRFSRLDARRFGEDNLDRRAFGGPLGVEEPTGGQCRDDWKNPNPGNASAVGACHLPVIGAAAGWGLGAHVV